MKPLLLFWLLLVNCFEGAYNSYERAYNSYEGAYKFNDAYLESIPRPCGSNNPNQNVVDLREPQSPGPFHDLTIFELTQPKQFLQNYPNIRAVSPSLAQVNSSYVFMVDLYLPAKYEVLKYLDAEGPQPARKALVMIFRGDLNPSVVEEYVCGPLPYVKSCRLLQLANRRNPVEFSIRPVAVLELQVAITTIWAQIKDKIEHILLESYEATVCENDEPGCLTFDIFPVGTSYLGDTNRRWTWLSAQYNIPYPFLHPVDFALLSDVTGSDSSRWSVLKVWYAGQIYESIEEFVEGYNSNSIPKLKLQKPVESETLFSTLNLKGIPSPRNIQRPPQQFEADGKRYSLKDRQVKYLDWTFNFRMSPFPGPSVYDIRFKGERIAYEIGLSEISIYYSGFAPMQQMYSYPDSAVLLGTHSKSLIPGADCPEFSTLINQTFWGQLTDEPSSYDSSFCLFEQNAGIPLRRHSSYEKSQGSFYGGMLDSVLTLRSILSVFSNDYIIDFTFHQNGIIQGQLTNTGYLLPSYFNRQETLYGYRINKNIVGNIHQIFAHFRVDLDIGGTCNRYETLNIVKDQIPLQQDPDVIKHQTKIVRDLKTTEKRAVFDYNFRKPKYHLVYNNNVRNDLGQEKSYRIHLEGIAHSLLPENIGGERSIPWARHQMVVTKFKDSERFSSSSYAYVDNLDPVVNFTKYYDDNERIVDQDLVFWITLGTHRIPHTEDIPVASTVGRELRFFLMPNNYFPECPSMNSRDALFIKHIDPKDKAKGVEVNRNGNSRDQCVTPKITLEDVLFRNPDLALESRRVNFVF